MQLPAQSILVAKNNETKQLERKRRKRRGRKDEVHWYFRASKTRNSKCWPHVGLSLKEMGNKTERESLKLVLFHNSLQPDKLNSWKGGNQKDETDLGNSPSFLHSLQRPQRHMVMEDGTRTNCSPEPAQ